MTATDHTATQAPPRRARRAPAATSPLTPARAAAGPVPRQPLVTSWSADTRWPDSIHWPSSPPPPAPARTAAPALPAPVPAPARTTAHGDEAASWLDARRAAFSGPRAAAGAALVAAAAAVPALAPGLTLSASVTALAPRPAIMGVVSLAAAALLAIAFVVVGVVSVRERGGANVIPSLLRTVVAVGLGAGIVAVVAPSALVVLPAVAGATCLVALVQGTVARALAAVACVATVAVVHAEPLVTAEIPLAAGLAATGVVLGLRLVVSALSQPAPAREVSTAVVTEPVWAPGSVDLTAFLPQRELADDVWQDAR